jgi:hypothetical protein
MGAATRAGNGWLHFWNQHLRPGWERCSRCLQEVTRYLIYLRIQCGIVAVVVLTFQAQQVKDVLLALSLDRQWGQFGAAAFFGGVLGALLWYSARRLTDLRYIRLDRRPGARRGAVLVRARFMPPGLVWWIPRLLGIVPLLALAAGFRFGVGDVGASHAMAALLLLGALALLLLLFLRTRLPAPLSPPAGGAAAPLAHLLADLTVGSGQSEGIFSPIAELVMLCLAWLNLAMITVPIARAAYGPFGGGVLHLYGLLLAGALLIGLWRLGDDNRRSDSQRNRSYWFTFFALLLSSALVPLLLNLVLGDAVLIPRALGSIAILYYALSILVVFGSTLHAFGIQTKIPLLTLVLAGALVLSVYRVNDNHAVRLLAVSPGAAASGTATSLPDLRTRFGQWIREPRRWRAVEGRSSGNPYPVYVVTAQGGGVYAAYHTAKALGVLTSAVPGFHSHTFAISGVSGGSVGATLYAQALDPEGDNRHIVERIDQAFDHDHLSPVLAAMLFGDFTQRFYPPPVPAWDRALGLELSFENSGTTLLDALSPPLPPISLADAFYAGQSARAAAGRQAPLLVLNTTEVDSGRRFLLSPFRFRSDAYFHEPAATAARGPQDLRYSTAAVMSARFPLISPYSFFDGTPEQREHRFVDGGYYDNSGAVTAGEIQTALRGIIEADPELRGRVAVFPIALINRSALSLRGADDAGSLQPSRTGPVKPKPLLGFSALDALFATREARLQKTMNDYGISCGADSSASDRSLCITLVQNFRLPDSDRERQIPLGWTLSCQSRAFLSSQMEPYATAERPTGVPASADIACLRRGNRGAELRKGEVPGRRVDDFPSFATIVRVVREQIQGPV